jgi:hypothetical protein
VIDQFFPLTIMIFDSRDAAQILQHDWIYVNVVNSLKDMISLGKNFIVSIVDANTQPI